MEPDELVESFALLEDWEDRYRYLIDLGKAHCDLDPSDKIDANKVRGCTSQVWMVTDIDLGPPARMTIRADSDAHIVKGLVAILIILYSGRTAKEIEKMDIKSLFRELELQEHLSPNRRNGFFAMVGRVQEEARALKSLPTLS